MEPARSKTFREFDIFRDPRVIVPVILLLAVALATVWFFHAFEKKEFEVHQGMSPAARNNPLLAAERYLQASGRDAVGQQGMGLFSNLPSPGDAIIIRHMPGALSRAITDNLFDWVEAGGHLLLVPNPNSSDHPGTDNPLERLGVQFRENDDSDCGCPLESADNSEDDTGTDQPEIEEDGDEGHHPFNRVSHLNIDGFPVQLQYFGATLLEDSDQAATYRINGSYHIEYREEADQKRSDNHKETRKEGAWLLQYEVGAGKVTVLSEIALFFNASIGKYDHAFFLSWLVRDAGRVWLLHATNAEGLLTLLWNRMPHLWISFIILIFLMLWKMQKQSGGPLRPQDDARRNILAHIDASGLYNWRINKSSTILEANRKTTLQWWAGRKLGLRPNRENRDIDIAALAARTGVSEDEFNQAFRQKVVNEQDLIRTSRALQRVRTLIQGGESAKNDRDDRNDR